MPKRDLVLEILQKQQRSADGRVDQYQSRVSTLKYTIKQVSAKLGHSQREWLKYVPVALCASVEGYVRATIARLIDFGPPYSERAKALSDIIKNRFDLELLLAVQEERITVGDFVSHLLPISSLSDVCSHMTALLGDDLLILVKPHFANYMSFMGERERPVVDVEVTDKAVRSDLVEAFRLTGC